MHLPCLSDHCPWQADEVAVYDGREHLGTTYAADGQTIAILANGFALGAFRDRESARKAILASRQNQMSGEAPSRLARSKVVQ